MQIKTISYKKIHNLGNYSSEHLEMFAELNEEDNPEECALRLRKKVWQILEQPVQNPDLNEDHIPY